MITKVSVKNFKKLNLIEFDLDKTVVLIGPNNSGKSTFLQALTLWEIGIKKIVEQQRTKTKKSKRIGVVINRRDLLAIPVSSARFIWFHQAVREINRTTSNQKTSNIRIEITVEGVKNGKKWKAPLEFDYANPESIYCRPLRKDINGNSFYDIDEEAFSAEIAFLQPMSGITTNEDRLTQGSINVRIGEGKTADVLRNICYQLLHSDSKENKIESENNWHSLNSTMKLKFGAEINKPIFIPETGTIEMTYIENGHVYDLSSSGRGFQQTLLLLAYLYTYKEKTILLDEPDAHLEVIRQRETYELINNIAQKLNSQLIIASHSEIVLNQAADGDKVIAFYDNYCSALNDPQQISQFKKLLTDIGWDKYFLAKTKKHIIYLEGATDLRMLTALANKLNHPVLPLLHKANINYTADNLPKTAQNNFHGLRNLIPDLKGIALFDRLEKEIQPDPYLNILQWKRREIENYFAFPEVLLRWANSLGEPTLFINYSDIMQDCINDNTAPANLKNRKNDWWNNCKMSDDYLPQIFINFYQKQNQSANFNKGRYYELIDFLLDNEIDPEVLEKLDSIYLVLKEIN